MNYEFSKANSLVKKYILSDKRYHVFIFGTVYENP